MAVSKPVYETTGTNNLVHRIFLMYYGTSSKRAKEIGYNSEKLVIRDGPTKGIYLSRDPEEAWTKGEVLIKVLAYTGKVKQLHNPNRPEDFPHGFDSFFYKRYVGDGRYSFEVTCIKEAKHVCILSTHEKSLLDKLWRKDEKKTLDILTTEDEDKLKKMVSSLGLQRRISPLGANDESRTGRSGVGGAGSSMGGAAVTQTAKLSTPRHQAQSLSLGVPIRNLNSDLVLPLYPLGKEPTTPLQLRKIMSAPLGIIEHGERHIRDALGFHGALCNIQKGTAVNIDYRDAEDVYKIMGKDVLRKIFNLALRVPEKIGLLKQGESSAMMLSQLQVASLMACAFLGALPPFYRKFGHLKNANFTSLYSAGMPEKIKCLRQYFDKVDDKEDGTRITYERRCIPTSKTGARFWRELTKPMLAIKYCVTSEGLIEDNSGMLQVDFANADIGGGVLDHGSVQEELMFLMCPELIISKLFTERLGDDECLVVTGFQRYSAISGYSYNFEWKGPHRDLAQIRREQRQVKLVAIDAQPFNWDKEAQYTEGAILRELHKAYVGFFNDEYPAAPVAVATGSWGCGAFGGDPHLKALIQLMAASANGRDLAFLTVRNTRLAQAVFDLYESVRECGMSAAQLYDFIVGYGNTVAPPGSTFAGYCSRRFARQSLQWPSPSVSPAGRKRSLPSSPTTANDSSQFKATFNWWENKPTGDNTATLDPERTPAAGYDKKKYESDAFGTSV